PGARTHQVLSPALETAGTLRVWASCAPCSAMNSTGETSGEARPIQIRELVAADAAAVDAFHCSTGERWARDVEETIHDDLMAVCVHGDSHHGLGAWIDDDLAGLIVWRRYGGENWWLALLATSLGRRGNGVAKALYREVIERARSEGVGLIFS